MTLVTLHDGRQVDSCTLCGGEGHKANRCPWVRCMDCNRASLLKNGFARCAVSPRRGWFPSPMFLRQCAQFVRAEAQAIAKRLEQYRAIGGRA